MWTFKTIGPLTKLILVKTLAFKQPVFHIQDKKTAQSVPSET